MTRERVRARRIDRSACVCIRPIEPQDLRAEQAARHDGHPSSATASDKLRTRWHRMPGGTVPVIAVGHDDRLHPDGRRLRQTDLGPGDPADLAAEAELPEHGPVR